MTKNTIQPTNPIPLAVVSDIMQQAGQAANEVAKTRVFDTALSGKAANTERRKRADIALFETFLHEVNVPAYDLYDNPQAWQGVTWGIVEGFKQWMLNKGYAVASINGRLSTVRGHAALAAKAGAIGDSESRLIASVRGYTHKEAVHVDERRQTDGLATRVGHKKAKAVTIPDDVAQALINQPNTPQGRRDALLMCLLLEHGLRVSEIAALTRQSFDLKAGTITFYRSKVDMTQTHIMTPATRKAAGAYLQYDALADGILWRKSHKGTGKLSVQLSATSAARALTKRVELLGRHAGIEGLSAHDGRHYWATYEARSETPIDRLRQAGGWKSIAMPLRYIADAEIANAGTAKVKSES
jgi:integrase